MKLKSLGKRNVWRKDEADYFENGVKDVYTVSVDQHNPSKRRYVLVEVEAIGDDDSSTEFRLKNQCCCAR